MLWSHGPKQRSIVYAKRKGSARNTMASSTIPPVGCTSLTMILCICTSSLPITIPLLPVTRATRKPKNSWNNSIIGLGWPQTSAHTSPGVTVAHTSKEVTQSPPALPYLCSQAQCLGWTSAQTSSWIFPSPTASTPSLRSSTDSPKKPSLFRAIRLPRLWTLLNYIYSTSGRTMVSLTPLLVIGARSLPCRS